MDIEGLGEETVDLLFNKGLLRNIADIYDLKYDQLVPLEGLGKKSADNIIKSIRESLEVPYPRVLFALGIRHVGETLAKNIAMKFRSIDDLMNAGSVELTAYNEIGPKIAASIITYFSDSENLEILRRLKIAGINFIHKDEAGQAGTILNGNTIVISGVFQSHSRDEYKDIIEKNGGRNSSSISGSTTFILAGENMGPSKKEKAVQLGIPLMSEKEFLKLIGEE